MTKLPRAFVALIPVAAVGAAVLGTVLVACTPVAENTVPTPVPTFSPTPSAGPELPTSTAQLEEWAAEALPVDRVNGRSAVLRGEGTLGRAPARIDVSQQSGPWDLLLTCQSEDASPVSYELNSPTSSVDGPTELGCPSPEGGTPATAVILFDGPDTTLELSATADAVYAYEVRPHENTAD